MGHPPDHSSDPASSAPLRGATPADASLIEPLGRPALAPDSRARTYGALDLGTNNCRLLIAHPQGSGFKVVESFSRITRLGEGLRATGTLSDAAMDRTLLALATCAERMERRGLHDARCVATAACRIAANVDTFIDRVATRTGLRLEVIPADEEARLALAGCAPLLGCDTPQTLVFDIGGGSTELTLVDVAPSPQGPVIAGIRAVESLPFGVVTLAEAAGGGHLSPRLHDDIVAHVRGRLASFEAAHDISARARRGEVAMLGTSGTVTTLGAVALGLPRYDRARVDGLVLPVSRIRAIAADLLGMSPGQRLAHPCIGRERADLVLAGCAILEAIISLWPVPSLRVADRGIREGLLMDLMGSGGPMEYADPGGGEDCPDLTRDPDHPASAPRPPCGARPTARPDAPRAESVSSRRPTAARTPTIVEALS